MSEAERIDWFWKIIDRARPGKIDQDEQLALVHNELEKLSPQELEAFGATMDRILTDSYSWDLWGAAYVIMGGASDDSFEYFRVWMISQGREFFEAAKADPDKLAALIPQGYDEAPDFELLAYVASEVWAQKTGHRPNEMPTQPPMMYIGREPAGKPFSEADSELAKRYPNVWARFGNAPL